MHLTLLQEVNFSIHKNWKENCKFLQEEFGIDFENQPSDAYRRLT